MRNSLIDKNICISSYSIYVKQFYFKRFSLV